MEEIKSYVDKLIDKYSNPIDFDSIINEKPCDLRTIATLSEFPTNKYIEDLIMIDEGDTIIIDDKFLTIINNKYNDIEQIVKRLQLADIIYDNYDKNTITIPSNELYKVISLLSLNAVEYLSNFNHYNILKKIQYHYLTYIYTLQDDTLYLRFKLMVDKLVSLRDELYVNESIIKILEEICNTIFILNHIHTTNVVVSSKILNILLSIIQLNINIDDTEKEHILKTIEHIKTTMPVILNVINDITKHITLKENYYNKVISSIYILHNLKPNFTNIDDMFENKWINKFEY